MGNAVRHMKIPCTLARCMVIEMTGLFAQDLIHDVHARGVNKPGNGEEYIIFDINELTCDCGDEGCPVLLGFDG